MKKFILRFDDFKKVHSVSVKNELFSFDDLGDVVKASDIKVSFNANKYGGIINVTGIINAVLSFECSRCLTLYSQNINVNFEVSFGEEELQLDLANEVKENIILNIPMKPLCRQDCKGICSVCGGNKNEKDCSCEEKIEKDFIAEKWSKIKNLNTISGGRNAKSKKKT